MRVMWRALCRFARRMLLSFGPVIAVAAGLVAVGAYATGSSQPSPTPDLGLLHSAAPPLTSPREPIPVTGTRSGDVILIARISDGTLRVTVNGRRVTCDAGPPQALVVAGRGGGDQIRVLGDVRVALALRGGAGDDLLVGGGGDDILVGGGGDDVIVGGAGDDLADGAAGDDTIRLGPGQDGADGAGGRDLLAGDGGDDYLQGGRGDDILQGGDGRDVLYGLDGRDRPMGGAGGDYLDGGAGADDVAGERGRDVVFGGAGDDVLSDVAGGDLLAGGDGQDTCVAGDGSRVVAPADGGWPTGFDVVQPEDGPFGLAMRVRSDLEALRSLPLGRELLADLAASGRVVTLRASAEGNALSWDAAADCYLRANGEAGAGTGSVVFYNPYRTVVGDGRRAWQHRPPIVGLFHELVHALAVASGTMPPERDRQQAEAVGVGAPSGYEPSENGLRAYLGLPLRPAE